MSGQLSLHPDRLIVAASALVDVMEAARRVHPVRWADTLGRYLGARQDDRWDTTLVRVSGHLSHFDYERNRSSWPLPAAATPDELAAFGRTYSLLRRDVKEGDILLQYSPLHRGFVRVGIAAAVLGRGQWTPSREYVDVLSIEGGTGRTWEPDGGHAVRIKRRLSASSGDRFLRWTAMKWNATAEVV